MNLRLASLDHLPHLVGGAVALLFGLGVMAYLPAAGRFDAAPTAASADSAQDRARSDPEAMPAPAPVAPGARTRCPGCGVVESVRAVTADGDAQPRFEITVRLRDGSTRVARVADPAQWQAGARTIFID